MTKQLQRAVVFGASSGVGRATARALEAQGTKVWAVSRTAGGDATDPAVVARVLDDAAPELVVVALGARPWMGPIEDASWADFTAIWDNDVKASFHVGQHTLRRPLAPGSTVVMLSSGAGLTGSYLSGGYAGAKRMQMFLADYLQKRSDARALGIRYVALVPKQLIADTEIGTKAAATYGATLGISTDEYMKRWDVPLDAGGVAAGILQIARGEAPPGVVLSITGAKGVEPV